MPIAQPCLSDRIVAEQAPGLAQRAGGRVRLSHETQLLPQLLPSLGQRLGAVGEARCAAGVDRALVQAHGVRVGEALGGAPGRGHRVAVRAGMITRQREVVREHRGIGIAGWILLVLEPEPDRFVEAATQLERKARVRGLL